MRIGTTPGAPPEERFFTFVYPPLRDAAGRIDGILGHGVDVTDLVRARQLAEEQAARLEATTAELEAANARPGTGRTSPSGTGPFPWSGGAPFRKPSCAAKPS